MSPHQILYVPDLIQPVPKFAMRGPEHSIFTEKQVLQLHVLAASLGSADLPQRSIDVTDALNDCIRTPGCSDGDGRNYIELNRNFNCTTMLLDGKDGEDGEDGEDGKKESQLSPRSQVSLRSNPLILYARWELSERSGFPFRRWTTKQTVKWRKIKNSTKNNNSTTSKSNTKRRMLLIDGPSVVLQPPMEPMLRVLPTSFLGNPNDPLLQYPVVEEIQAAIDLDFVEEEEEEEEEEKEEEEEEMGKKRGKGRKREKKQKKEKEMSIAPDHKDGSFLVLGPRNSKLIQNIGDPYPGADKILRLDLDMQVRVFLNYFDLFFKIFLIILSKLTY